MSQPGRLPPLNALRVFLVVAEQLSFTRAAGLLHLTQGAVSRQIQALEAFFGVPLFVRQSRTLALTARGHALLPPVREAFRILSEASRALTAGQSDLRVKVGPTLAMRWLLPNLPAFQLQHPDLTLHLITTMGMGGPFDRAEYDVAVEGVLGPGREPGMHYEPLAREQLVPVCSPALLATGKPLRTPADLRHYTLLHPWRDHDSWREWLTLAGAHQVRTDGGMYFDTLEFALHAAAGGMGVALAELSMIRDDVERGRLVMPFDLVLETDWRYYIVCPEEEAGLGKIRAFRDWVVASSAHAGRAG